VAISDRDLDVASADIPVTRDAREVLERAADRARVERVAEQSTQDQPEQGHGEAQGRESAH